MFELWQPIVTISQSRRAAALAAFGQVLMIDIMLAGDNAIVVGALAAGLPAEQRKKVIMIGIIAALVLRIVFALVVTQLCRSSAWSSPAACCCSGCAWKMYRELRHAPGRSRDARQRSRRASGRPRASPRPPGRSRSPTSR